MQRIRFAHLVVGIICSAWVAGCMDRRPPAGSAEFLDERSGITVAALPKPVEFVQRADDPGRGIGRRPTFAYLGPVEWDRAGQLRQGLWLQVAPGEGGRPGDLGAAGAVHLLLDDAAAALDPMPAPGTARAPYRAVVDWGPSAYYALDARTLERLATSRRLELTIAGADGTAIRLTPAGGGLDDLRRFARTHTPAH